MGANFDSKWSCFGASSPADFEVKNPTNKKVNIVFLVDSKESGYERLWTLKLQPKETKVICLENEEAIKDGLFIYIDKSVSKIKLSNLEMNRFDVSPSSFRIYLTQ